MPQPTPPRTYEGKPTIAGKLVARLAAAVAPSADNRWNLYTGVPCLTVVEAVNGGQPFFVVVDIASLDAPARLKAFADHIEETWAAVGTWSSPTLADDGVRYDFEPLPLAAPEDRWSFPRAAEVGLLVKAKFPLQASIGFEPGADGAYLRVAARERINGRDIDPAAFDRPVFKLVKGRLNEGSTVLEGADENTGAGLSRHPITPPQEPPPMSTPIPADLKAMLAKYPEHKALVAECVAEKQTEAEIATAVKDAKASAALAASDARVTELQAQLTKAGTQVTELQAQLAKATGKQPPPNPPKTPPMPKDGEEEAAAPASLAAALALHQVEHAAGKLPMQARLADVRRRYPDLGKPQA